MKETNDLLKTNFQKINVILKNQNLTDSRLNKVIAATLIKHNENPQKAVALSESMKGVYKDKDVTVYNVEKQEKFNKERSDYEKGEGNYFDAHEFDVALADAGDTETQKQLQSYDKFEKLKTNIPKIEIKTDAEVMVSAVKNFNQTVEKFKNYINNSIYGDKLSNTVLQLSESWGTE